MQARHRPPEERIGVDEIDNVLHADRLDGRRQRRHRAILSALPDGIMLCPPHKPEQPHLLWRGSLRAWSHEGYAAPRAIDCAATVEVLTPRAIVAAIAAGYEPAVHSSATTG